MYEEPGKKKVYSVGPDLTAGVRGTDLTSVRYEYSYPDSNSNHSKVRKGFYLTSCCSLCCKCY